MKNLKKIVRKRKIVSLIIFFFIVISTFVVYNRAKQIQIMQLMTGGTYKCHGCSNVYDKAFARWESTTADCTGIIGTPKYTPSCGCSAPGKPLPDGFAADICAWPGPYVCSGCTGKQNSAGLTVQDSFATWISRYDDCSGPIYNERIGLGPQYNLQDPYCNAFSAERLPSPTSTPTTPYCTVTARNNPCPLYQGQRQCHVRVDWSYNVPDSRYEMHSILIPLLGMRRGEGTLHDDNYGRDGKHYGSVVLTKGWLETGLLEGKIDGVTKCQLAISFVEVGQPVTYPDNPAPDCSTACNNLSGSCRNLKWDGTTSGCQEDEVLCEVGIDACGCASRLACAKKSVGGCEAQRDRFGPWRKATDIYQRICGDKKRNEE